MRTTKLIVASLLLVCLTASGCGHAPTPEEQKSVDDLHTIISLYIVTQNRLGQPPANVDDIRKIFTEASSEKDVKLLDDGRYVVVWKTPADPGAKDAATTVLAFEKGAYTKGGVVQMVSGVDTPFMTADALKAALAKNPAWNAALMDEKPAAPKQ